MCYTGSMENLHRAAFSKRTALCAVLTAPLWGLALILFLPPAGMLLTVYTLGERVLRRKLREAT